MKKPLLNEVPEMASCGRQMHQEYFDNLEQRLLDESNKFAEIIGKKEGRQSSIRQVMEEDQPIQITIGKQKNSPEKNRDQRQDHGVTKTNIPFEQISRKIAYNCLKVRPLDSPYESLPFSAYASSTTTTMPYALQISSPPFGLQTPQSLKVFSSKDSPEDTRHNSQPRVITTYPNLLIITPNSPQSHHDRLKDNLKQTVSTSNSDSLLRAYQKFQKIKRLSNKSSKSTSSNKINPKMMSIEEFQLLKFLERGQFGAVYLARHIRTNFICAIKSIPKRLLQKDMKIAQQILREIRIQSFLDHPNIVQLYSFFADDHNFYLVMELCCAGNVYAKLRQLRCFSQVKVKNIIKQVCHAVEYMHDNDIIHRDIKPENILFHQEIVKVCDFGWSINSPMLRNTRCGTPLYSSPEIVQQIHYDNKVDVWNIGILTYELLYGRVPFEIYCEQDLGKIIDEDIYFPKSVQVSEAAKDFIMCCLQKDPKLRSAMNRLIDHDFIIRS